MIDPNQHDRFVLRQRIKLAINQYVFSIPEGEGDGTPFCFVEQKRFKFKEDIRFFADDTKTQELMKILARQRFDPRAKYDITDAAGGKIGMIQKVFGKSLLRSTYTLFDAQGAEVATVREKNLVTALFAARSGSSPTSATSPTGCPSPTTSSSPLARRCSEPTAAGAGSSATSTTWTSRPTPSTVSTVVSSSRPPSDSTLFKRAE